ncbi:Armadillo-type fold domain containing protein [Pseudohyphozyma bogoriensis]|nr:Armadillo-type fold domain containing protein [Pseudohyphozyma bogoriensis]
MPAQSKGDKPQGGSSTLRSLRHSAGVRTQSPKASPKARATASLTVKEQIARRAAKPLIQGRQFKWISPAQRMAEMTVDLARVRDQREMLEDEAAGVDDETHSLFGHALATSALLNLSLPFTAFSRVVEPKSRSLPLVIHHRDAIVTAICAALRAKQSDLELSGEHILDLLPSLITDLSALLLPSLPLLLTTLINLTVPSPLVSANPKLLQKVYDVLGALFRDLGKDILGSSDVGGMSDVWELVRRGLGAPAREQPSEPEKKEESEAMEVEEPSVEREADEADDEVEDAEEDVPPIASTSSQPLPPASSPPPRTLPSHLRTTPQTRRLLGSAFAFLAANNFLHSRTSAITRCLISTVLSLPSGAGSLPSDIISHTITTLAVHSTTAETFDPVVDEVLGAATRLGGGEPDWEKLGIMMKAVETIVGVKQGARVSTTRRPKVVSILSPFSAFVLASLQPTSDFLRSFTTMSTGVLLLTTLQDVLSGPARKSIEALFAESATPDIYGAACALATSLEEASWNLYSTAILPLVLSSTSRYLESEPSAELAFGDVSPSSNALALLARLAFSGRLGSAYQSAGPTIKIWEKTIGVVCEKKIRDWTASYAKDEVDEAHTTELLDALLIVPQLPAFFSTILPLLSQLASTVASTPSDAARAAYLSSPTNPAQVLGAALLSFSRIISRVKESDVATSVLAKDVVAMIKGFAWHRGVMEGIAALSLSQANDDRSTEDNKRIYDAILPNLLSEDSILRMSSLQIASSLFTSKTPVTADLIAKCIDAESIPLSVQGAREKSMKVRKLGIVAYAQLGRDGEAVDQPLDIVLRYLTAMLKVNFKPLWPEAIGALKTLSERFPEPVWQICSRQLITASTRDSGLYVSRKPEWAQASHGRDVDAVFEEQQLRDFHLEELRKVVGRELRLFEGGVEASEARETALIAAQVAPERLVVASYEAQLLALFCEIPDLAQRHSRDFTEVFFGCFQRDEAFAPPKSADAATTQLTFVQPDETSKERKIRLIAWLTLYSKFSNPKALYRAEDLANQFRTLLAFPDAEVQKVALDCLLRRKSAALTANTQRLKNLLEPSNLRDELLQFVSDEEAGGLEASHRAEVVPLFIRITYGIMTSRQGRASASSGQGRAGRRAAILGALKTCSIEELSTLVDLTIGPLRKVLVTPPGESFRLAEQAPRVSGKRQLGFLGFLADILKHLGKDLVDRWPDLLGATLNLLYFAQKGIQAESAGVEPEDVDEEQEVVEEDGEDEAEAGLAPLRSIRQLSLKRLADFFRLDVDFDFSPYVSAAFPVVISPRLPQLAAENAQAPSALLELFVTWAHRRDLAQNLVRHDASLLPALYGCLTVRNVKPAVILRVFDIVSNLVEFAAEDGGKDSEIGRTLVQPGVSTLLAQLAGLFQSNAASIDSKHEVGQRQISVLCSLAPYVSSSEQASNFLSLITPMLRKANKTVPEKVKSDLLKIFTALYPLARPPSSDPLQDKCFESLSSLFGSARTRGARLHLVAAFLAFASVEETYLPIARLIEEINSYSVKRSEEPDFDRRLAAFSTLNEDIYRTIRPTDWIAVIHNMFFFIQDPEELAIRSNASFSLRRFLEVAGTSEDADIQSIVIRVLLPGLRRSLHSKLDVVRSEILGVYANAVERLSGVAELDQLKCLLVGGDQEANFFYNILHIQVHRRTRALRRLADEVEAGSISSKVVSEVFLPLLDHFIMAADDKKDPDLVNETVQCIGRISKHLVWSGYNKIAQHYLKLAKAPGTAQKACVRTLVAVLKGFHFDLTTDNRLLDVTTSKLLPELLKYLEKRDDTNEEVRIPVAEGISAVVQHLPEGAKETPQTALLMALAQILRSTDQHLRDATRVTLCNIAASAGNQVLPELVKELRRALQRGPQLHVLAFTVHALLVRLAANPDDVDFDGALSEIVPVLGEDVFGNPAKDRGSQEFRAKTKFREVRSFKSMDSFQLLGQTVSPEKISALLAPIRDLLQRTDSAKPLKEADEVLRRLALGLTMNKRLNPIAILDLCHSLIGQNANFLRPARVAKKGRKAAADYHVQLTRHDEEERDFYAKNAHKFVSFGLDLFNSAYRKSQFDLESPVIIGRLEPLVSLVGTALYSDDPTVLARSMRATAALIRCPLSTVDKAAPVLVKQMISVVQRSGSTESELAQSSLRTLAIVIRDCKAATLREDQLTELLLLIGPDLEEADRQATLFQLLRAIMARKFVAPEIYDLMDKVAEILVTNQSSNIREICRAVYLQFLLDYPQGRGRLKNSLAFLAKNLSFVHESGRLSVLELMSAILNKFASQLLEESSDLFFVGLVMVVANDDSTRCREMAAELIKLLLTRVTKDGRDSLLSMLQTWAGKREQQQLARTAVQLFGVAIEAMGADGRAYASDILDVLGEVLEESHAALEDAEAAGEQEMELDLDWQLPYQALQSLAHVNTAFPDLVSPDVSSNRAVWLAVRGHLLFPHIWIRTSASRLLGSLYGASGSALAKSDLPADHPLSTSSLLDAAQKGCLQLKSPLLTEALAMQIVKNLFFAAKCFAARRTTSDEEDADEEEEEGDAEERQADPLRWLFTRLSYQIRAAHIARPSMHAVTPGPWSLQPASILRWFAAVVNHLDENTLNTFLIQMATPIFRISEDPNAQDPQMVELQTLAREVQEMIQTKIGTTAYSTVHTKIRQKAAERRNERKTALALQAINDPAEDAKRKAKRNEQKSRQKKRKASAFADQKLRFGIGHSKKRRDA